MDVGLGAALAAGMDEVARRFEGKDWSTKEHFKIKASSSEVAPVENRFMKAYRERLQSTDLNDKQRRMTTQVRKMLLKSKASGRSDLHPDERFYLEVRFGTTEEAVDYVFCSRLRTAGRVLDELVGKHGQALKAGYDGWTGVYGLVSERSGGGWVSLGKVLSDMDPEVLQSCDVVTILPYIPPTTQEGAAVVAADDDVKGSVAAEGMAMTEEASPSSSDQGGQEGADAGQPPASIDGGSGSTAAVADATIGGVVLIVQEGKVGHPVSFTEAEWPTVTGADLKARIEAATGMVARRQKLLFKGVLSDAQVLSQTKLKTGSKITLMTAGK